MVGSVGEARVEREVETGEATADALPTRVARSVNFGDPVAVVVDHVEEFGAAVAVEVCEVEDVTRARVEVAVGLEDGGVSAAIEGEEDELRRRAESVDARAERDDEIADAVAVEVAFVDGLVVRVRLGL